MVCIEYTINKLAKISDVSTRTLRYYHEIGLLTPKKVNSNGYRIYGEQEVDSLQEILFYRELKFSLDDIKKLINSPDYNRLESLNRHLEALNQKRAQIDLLINNVTKTAANVKGEIIMNDKEKFEGFKQSLIDENEKKYGVEIREKYGDDIINKSNAKFKNMTKEQADEIDKLSNEFNEMLKQAAAEGDPKGEAAQKACDLHRKWLCFFWEEGQYSKEAHKNIAQMYVDDERFKAHYDNIVQDGAEFLKDAVEVYCG